MEKKLSGSKTITETRSVNLSGAEFPNPPVCGFGSTNCYPPYLQPSMSLIRSSVIKLPSLTEKCANVKPNNCSERPNAK